MFKTIIIEDDPFAQEMLRDLLLHHPEYNVMATYTTVQESVKSLPLISPDLVFLDMELTDGKGFDILQQLPHINFEIIITTMHDSYMLQAIQHSALDYLLKPLSDSNLSAALQRFENRINEKKAAEGKNPIQRSNKIILSMKEELLFLEISEIIRVESDGAYSVFHTKDKKKYTTSRTLATYEPKLQPYGFFRIHNSHLINLNHIGKYVKGEGGYVIMSDNSSVEVSRRKKEEFLKALAI